MKDLVDLLNLDDSTIAPAPKIDSSVQVVIPASDGTSEEVDFETARDNYYSLLEQAKQAITVGIHIVNETQKPAALDVLSKLLKSAADMNSQLLQLSKTKKEIKGEQKAVVEIPKVNGVTYIGSSANLNKMIGDVDD